MCSCLWLYGSHLAIFRQSIFSPIMISVVHIRHSWDSRQSEIFANWVFEPLSFSAFDPLILFDLLHSWFLRLSQYCFESRTTDTSMTLLLTHNVAHSTRHSFRPKTNNQPIKKFLSLEFSWVKVVKNWTSF